MAEEENKEETAQEKKKSNTLMIVIIAILVLIILGGAVTAILLMSDDSTETQVQQSTTQTQNKTSANRLRGSSDEDESRKLSDIGILYPLDGFTVNLKSDSGSRYLKATISLELNGEELSIELDKKSPVIRDRIIRILTSKTLEEISSKKGKKKVSDQIMDTLNAMIVDGQVKGIYFTEFVIQ